MQGHPIQPIITKEHTSPSLSRAVSGLIMPALLTTFHGEMEKRNPLLLASLNQSCFSLFSLFALLAVQKPLHRALLMLSQRKTPSVRPTWKRDEAPNLN